MSESQNCSECGTEIPRGSTTEGLCPACLLRGVLAAVDEGSADEAPTLAGSHDGDREPRVGQRLEAGREFGHYRIHRLLGRGGMGEVYEAEDLDSGRRLALKVLTQGLGTADDRARFLREGRLAASISHPSTVYVYGTEEIEGLPVIAMALARGGTLKDRVATDGPLASATAVDAILEVVSGLQVASAAGILHRDIKPSNCFVDADGGVKIGDFGLSISTLAREEADLTREGSFLGTPAFASPEQLRSEDLDERSDIYGVGATLYFLLSGRAPFEGTNLLGLATRIAQDPPAPLRTLQSHVSEGLEGVISRCLAKRPAERPSGYAELVRELRPFSSEAPQPAPPGRRMLAGLVDWLVVGAITMPISVALMGLDAKIHLGVHMLVAGLYFAICEGSWRSSAGKALCDLRVLSSEGHRAPPASVLARSFAFAAVFRGAYYFNVPASTIVEGQLWYPPFFANYSGPNPITFGGAIGHGPLAAPIPFLGVDAGLVALLLLFVMARPRNGFAGLHDRMTSTMVARGASVPRPSSRGHAPDLAPAAATSPRFGPYEVVDALGGALFLGYDRKLRRRVWIVVRPPGVQPITGNRRDLARPTRLRWLNGSREPERSWDAYEAVAGEPLIELTRQPQPWRTVRGWIRDLAVELEAGIEDGSLPVLATDRIWISSAGRAMLLDWPAPDTVERSPVPQETVADEVDLSSAQAFLRSVAALSLCGGDLPEDEVPPVPLPLPARRFLVRLRDGSFESSTRLAEAARRLVAAPAEISARTRLAHLSFCAVLPAFVTTYLTPGVVALTIWGALHPQQARLVSLVQAHQILEQSRSDEPDVRRTPALDQIDASQLGYEEADLPRLREALETHITANRSYFESPDLELPRSYQHGVPPPWRSSRLAEIQPRKMSTRQRASSDRYWKSERATTPSLCGICW